MIEKDKLVELMQKYLQAATELWNYTESEDMCTPCGFYPGEPIHIYATPATYDGWKKLFDSSPTSVECVGESGDYYEFATIGGTPVKIYWNAKEYKEVHG